MKIVQYLLVVLITGLVAGLGSWLTTQGIEWYYLSHLPTLAPAGSVIGGVWTVVFIASAGSLILWLQQKEKTANYYRVIWWFGVNAVLNLAWTYLFFFQRQVGASIIEMVGLELSVLILIWLMWKKRIYSSILLIPYAVWVLFATYLAYNFWILNR